MCCIDHASLIKHQLYAHTTSGGHCGRAWDRDYSHRHKSMTEHREGRRKEARKETSEELEAGDIEVTTPPS